MKILIFAIFKLLVYQHEIVDNLEYTLFSNKEDFYILKKDVVLKRVGSGWKIIPHVLDFENYSFDPINDGNLTYLVSKGLGKVLEFKNDSIYEIDNSTFWKSKYESFNFMRKNLIYSFGGYGFYIYRNDMLFFDAKSQEWFKYNINITNSPPPSAINFGFYNDETDILYVGLGNNDSSMQNEIYSYDFKSNIWNKFGSAGINLISYTKTHNYFDNLIIVQNNLYSIDFHDFIVKKHDSPYPDLESIDQMHFNKQTNKFIIARNRSMSKSLDIQILDEVDFIGRSYDVSRFKINYRNKIIFFVTIIISSFIVMLLIRKIKKPKNLYHIKKYITESNNELGDIDIMFLSLILDRYPSPIKYLEFMNLLDNSLAYETKVKKVRESIIRINIVVSKLLKSRNNALITSRNIDDNRIKEVKLQL